MAHIPINFDCKNKNHVLWLKKVSNAMKKDDAINITNIINNNPLPGKPSIDSYINWKNAYSEICANYTDAVLNFNAYVPDK